MTQSITPSTGAVEVPTQRIMPTAQLPAAARDGVAPPVEPAELFAEPDERPHLTEWQELVLPSEPLPDLVSPLAAVPGGLGTDLGTDLVQGFTFADQRWTADDARWDATPIGAQLAMEQRGLGTPAGSEPPGARRRHAAD